MKEITKEVSERSELQKTETLVINSLARLDALALGAAVGTLFGVQIFIATNFLIYKGGNEIGPNLSLLANYFVGYDVTPAGSLVGLFYGLFFGFLLGSLIAFLRNTVVTVYLRLQQLKSGISAFNDSIDNP